MTVWRTSDPTARLTDPDDAVDPVSTTASAAQQRVNFVVFCPTWLPADCSVVDVSLRPELPPGRPAGADAAAFDQTPHTEGNRCSLRTVVEGDYRRLRLKQFCYDWAPSAGGIAGIWHTSDPDPFPCADAVGFLGDDYRDNRGGVVQRDRTQVEASVTAGAFSDDDLRRLMSGLTPADPSGASVVRGVPFHRLNYWVRHRYRPFGVTHGLWEHRPARPYDECRRLSRSALAAGSEPTLPVQPLVPAEEAFVFDSAVAFPEAEAVECLFRYRANGSDHLWLTAATEGSPLTPDLPPEPADQAAATREPVELRGTTVYYAALTEDSGGWEATWCEDETRHVVWGGPSQDLDGEAFRTVIANLVAP